MNLALGVLFLWLGSACLWVATHGTQADSPWGAFTEVVGGIRNS